jgi:transcriptional regulator
MYTPRAFVVQDPATLQELIHRYSFATLVTAADGLPTATHLPLLLEARGEQGTLVGHVARANPQWRAFDGHTEALAIFSGPHGYVSPSLYATQPSVPTWDYMVAHVYGAPCVVEDEETLRRLVLGLVERFESGRPHPFEPAYPEDWLRNMMRGIVAFEMPIMRIEGSFKLSQNRTETDRASVAAAFSASESSEERAVAEAMRTLGIVDQ